MKNQEFLEVFQESANLLREQTVQELLESHTEYKAMCQQEDAAERKYLKLALTEEQREVIDALLQEKERGCLLYADMNYLAGVKNVLQLRQALKL